MNNFSKIKKILGKWLSIPWYFILFSIYPVLALMSFNVGQVKAELVWRPLFVSIAFAVVLFALCRLLIWDMYRAAILSTFLQVLFFSYGHIYNLLVEKWEEINFTPYLLTTWAILLLLFIVWVTRKRFLFKDTVLALNVVALGLVVSSLVQIGAGDQKGSGHYVRAKNAPIQKDLVRPQDAPDVYYFILDSYAREDLLKMAYGYDNSTFLNELRKRGFYIAECSQSNYGRTEISLGSSLNMSYLQDLDPAFTPESTKRGTLWDSLKHSAVRYNFDEMGYTTVNFATGYAWNELEDADIFYTPDSFSVGMSEFEALFIQTTLARYANDLGWFDSDQIMGQNFRGRFLNVFDRIDDIARNPEPTFAYIHLISPHPPFVFGPSGDPTYPPDFWNEDREYPADMYARGYQNQLTFLNRKILEAVDTLLAESDTPPIIILQGDHGPWLQPKEKRMWVLNAYYLPGQNDKLYSTITPVNTFRLVFDTYFGGKYGLLEDVTYFSPVPKLYEFSEIPNLCTK